MLTIQFYLFNFHNFSMQPIPGLRLRVGGDELHAEAREEALVQRGAGAEGEGEGLRGEEGADGEEPVPRDITKN